MTWANVDILPLPFHCVHRSCAVTISDRFEERLLSRVAVIGCTRAAYATVGLIQDEYHGMNIFVLFLSHPILPRTCRKPFTAKRNPRFLSEEDPNTEHQNRFDARFYSVIVYGELFVIHVMHFCIHPVSHRYSSGTPAPHRPLRLLYMCCMRLGRGRRAITTPAPP